MAHGIIPSHPIGTLSGHAYPVLNYLEGTSQVFKAGDFVVGASGYLTVCGADPVLILGMALEDAHNTTAGLYTIPVALALETVLFGMSVYHATAGNNLIEATDMFLLCDIAMSAYGKWVADKAVVTTTSRLRILKFVEPLATVSGIVAGVIAATYRQIGFVGA